MRDELGRFQSMRGNPALSLYADFPPWRGERERVLDEAVANVWAQYHLIPTKTCGSAVAEAVRAEFARLWASR